MMYKDEYGHIDPFDYGSLPADVKINWNVGNGYEFMIYDLQLAGTMTFSYTIQYDGKKDVVRIEIESNAPDLFRGSKTQ
ncbi:MAG: hypothetical protein H6765_04075 [Candidatus Peribacteria bacterium]|nr:MAG: hypothetical protein H6765_04075 [Candidatus Peribacteria bacterium]